MNSTGLTHEEVMRSCEESRVANGANFQPSLIGECVRINGKTFQITDVPDYHSLTVQPVTF